MSTATGNARRCFDENVGRISQDHEPIAWNLNNGLRNLCDALEGIEKELEQIRRDLNARK